MHVLTVQIVALKFIPKLNKSAEDLLALQREVNIMRELRHENIIALYDWFETDTEVNGELGGGAEASQYSSSVHRLICWSIPPPFLTAGVCSDRVC